MEKVTEWDYTMTGDEFELVMHWAKSAYISMGSCSYDNWSNEIYDDELFEKLQNLEDRIFKDKTKTKDEWEEEIYSLQKSIINKYNLKVKR